MQFGDFFVGAEVSSETELRNPRNSGLSETGMPVDNHAGYSYLLEKVAFAVHTDHYHYQDNSPALVLQRSSVGCSRIENPDQDLLVEPTLLQ
jgi:hypothetical protein